MRLFNEKVFDLFISGTEYVYTDEKWNDLLGMADTLKVFVIVDSVSGTNPALTLIFEDSNDGRYWYPVAPGAAVIGGIDLTPGQTTAVSGAVGLGTPLEFALGAYVRVAFFLTGADNKAHVRVIVCGRGDYSGDVQVPFNPRP
jgi:hypothetical protein